jgi:hypothetical protein
MPKGCTRCQNEKKPGIRRASSSAQSGELLLLLAGLVAVRLAIALVLVLLLLAGFVLIRLGGRGGLVGFIFIISHRISFQETHSKKYLSRQLMWGDNLEMQEREQNYFWLNIPLFDLSERLVDGYGDLAPRLLLKARKKRERRNCHSRRFTRARLLAVEIYTCCSFAG